MDRSVVLTHQVHLTVEKGIATYVTQSGLHINHV